MREEISSERDAAGGIRRRIPFRPEIEGMRALAVVAVIVYHGFSNVLPAGYLGVDVFFVVSGYLITSIVLADLRDGTFSLLRFYERRVRRIMPALLVMIAATSTFAWLWMHPGQMESYAKSVVASASSLSNFWFLHTTGYFQLAGEYLPLLHTWSLAVEEQFYLLLPVVLLSWHRTRGSGESVLFIAATIVSLLLAVVVDSYSPDASFYLMPTRLWELMFGAWLASAGVVARVRTLDRSVREFCSAVGFAVLLGVFVTSPYVMAQRVPLTLITVLATATVITLADAATRVGRWLSVRPFTYVGSISYSLYLWHQPLFALARIERFGAQNEPWGVASLIAAIFALSMLSRRFIEAPFLRPGYMRTRTALTVIGGGAAVLAAFGAAGIVTNGFADRFPNQPEFPTEKRMTMVNEKCRIPEPVLCSLGSPAGDDAPKIAVFGDSHANKLLPALDEAARRAGLSVISLAAPGCPPLVGVDVDRDRAAQGRCIDIVRRQLEAVQRHAVTDVILIARWNRYTGTLGSSGSSLWPVDAGVLTLLPDSARRTMFERALAATIARYREHGVRVHVVLQAPEQRVEARWFFYRVMRGDLGDFESLDRSIRTWSVSTAAHEKYQDPDRRSIRGMLTDGEAIDLDSYLCDVERCPFGFAGQPYYVDTHHLNELGAMRTVPAFEAFFDRIAARRSGRVRGAV